MNESATNIGVVLPYLERDCPRSAIEVKAVDDTRRGVDVDACHAIDERSLTVGVSE